MALWKLVPVAPLQTQRFDLSGSVIFKFFIISLILVAISDVPNSWGMIYYGAQGVLALLIFSVILLPFRPALVLFLLLLIAGNDIVSSMDNTMYSTASIWQMQFGPLKPSWIVFGCLLTKLVQARGLRISLPVKRAILWFATVPIVTGLLYGGFFTDHAMTEVIIDIKFPLMLLGSTVLFQTAYKNDRPFFWFVLSAFIGGILARHLMDLVTLAANYGPAIAVDISRGSEDSAKGGVVFLIYFGGCILLAKRRLLLGLSIAIPSVLLLIGYNTRMLWITFMIGTILLFLFLSIRNKISFIAIVTIITLVGGWSLYIVNSDSIELALARSKMITKGRSIDKFAVAVDYNLVSRIDPIRYGEVLNIFHSNYKRLSFLWGSGYGGYYEDDVISFPRDLMDSFPQYSLDSKKFYRAHFYLIHIFHKHGLFGLLLISVLWLVPGYSLFKYIREANKLTSTQPFWEYAIMFSFAAFIPTAMFCLYWSGKGLFINGLVIASCIEFVHTKRNILAHNLRLSPQVTAN